MTRENKLALVIGFGLILFVGILISDHFSAQRLDSAQLTQAALAKPRTEAEVQPLGLPQDLRSQTTGQVITLVPPSEATAPATAPGVAPGVTPGAGSSEVAGITPEPLPITVAVGDEDDGTPVRFYKVASGDTLWKIAVREYGDGTLSTELASYNKEALKHGDSLSLGQELRLPSLKKLRPTRMATSVADAALGTRQPASTAQASRTHTVAKGDTVYQLARKFNIKPQAIMAANGIRDAGSLKPGQTLVIPTGTF